MAWALTGANMTNRNLNLRKYVTAFVITAAIFATAMFINNFFNEKRAEQIRDIKDGISIDILSLETQFELLAERSCKDIAENTILSDELASLARKLSYMEKSLGTDNAEVLQLKRFYSLLEIKDLLLMKRVAQKCELEPVFLLYFYSNENDCKDCRRQGYVLTELARKYPKLRIYSFEYNLDLAVVKTLISLREVKNQLPAIVVEDDVYNGYKSVEEIEEIIPQLAELKADEETATSTTTSTSQ